MKLIFVTRADFVIVALVALAHTSIHQSLWLTMHQSLWLTPQFKAISECRQMKFSQAEIRNKRSRKVALKPVRATLAWCGRREVVKRKYVLITKEAGYI